MNPIFERHLEELTQRLAPLPVHQTPLPSGSVLITVDNVPLPPGWNREQTSIRFVAPTGYPFAQPDCFWADPGLALANGLVPQSSNQQQPIPETNAPGTWFSWHVQHWNPNRDGLLSFFRVIEQRLKQVL
jgi:hypothetical protein